MARPSSFNEAIANEICERIADGDSLRFICEGDEFPERRTVFKWLANPDHEAFPHQYTPAREASAEADDGDIRDMAGCVARSPPMPPSYPPETKGNSVNIGEQLTSQTQA